MRNILQIIYGLNVGGAEAFLYNVLSELEDEDFHIDFVIQDWEIKNHKLYDLCLRKGFRIYKVPAFNRNLYGYIKSMNKIMQESYDVVHFHANALINIIPLLFVSKQRMKIIVHSHNSCNNLGGALGKIIHLFNRKLIEKIATINVACSTMAGKWMFGNQEFLLINNGINIDTYKFNPEKREHIRKKYGIEGRTVIGHVGRFVEAKNHEHILHVFKKYVCEDNNAVLMLVGDGPLKNDIVNLAKKLNISERVIFTGEIQDTSKFYNAFDCILFPSLYEGLPFVLVEAQANGLPIVASANVTREIDLIGNVQFLSLDSEIEKWTTALKKRLSYAERFKCAEKMKKTRYNIETVVSMVKSLYLAN